MTTPRTGVSTCLSAITVASLHKRYGAGDRGILALEDINLTIDDGAFVAIVGPSGCGKSTLLRILAGLETVSEGAAQLRGTAITGPRRDIGVVFQTPVLFPWRTILENVLLPVDVQRLGRASHLQDARDLLAMAGLTAFADHYPNQLSGGMQQRVGLVRALIHDPALLLMDEPFGALDAMTRETMNLELQRIWMERRKTVVFVTHSITEAVLLADRVVVMSPRPGRIAGDITIDLARPRDLAVANTSRFGSYVAEIRAMLNAKGGID